MARRISPHSSPVRAAHRQCQRGFRQEPHVRAVDLNPVLGAVHPVGGHGARHDVVEGSRFPNAPSSAGRAHRREPSAEIPEPGALPPWIVHFRNVCIATDCTLASVFSTPWFSSPMRSFCRCSCCFRAVTSLTAPNHSMISPLACRSGMARDDTQPRLPSTRRTRCSRSKSLLARMACSIASMTRG